MYPLKEVGNCNPAMLVEGGNWNICEQTQCVQIIITPIVIDNFQMCVLSYVYELSYSINVEYTRV